MLEIRSRDRPRAWAEVDVRIRSRVESARIRRCRDRAPPPAGLAAGLNRLTRRARRHPRTAADSYRYVEQRTPRDRHSRRRRRLATEQERCRRAVSRSRRAASCPPVSFARTEATGCAAVAVVNPVAMTVILTLPFSCGSTTAPKMMLASSSAASWTMHDASLTSTSDRSGPPVTLMITPRAPLTDAPSSSGLEIARRAASMRAVRPFGDAGAHHRQPHAGHDGFHVGEVEVDEPRHQDEIRDALDRLPQHVVGGRERLGHRRGAVDDGQQPLVRNRDDRVDAVAQRFEARARPASARFLPSNLNGLVTTATVSAPSSLARLAITGARAGAGAAAEARRHEDHVGAVERLDDLLRVLERRLPARRSDRRRRRVPSSACRRSAASTGRRAGAAAPGDRCWRR